MRILGLLTVLLSALTLAGFLHRLCPGLRARDDFHQQTADPHAGVCSSFAQAEG